MIKSVLTSLQSSSANRPRWIVNGFMLLREKLTDIGKVAGDSSGRRHRRTDQVGAAAWSLAALEIAIAGACRPLAGPEPICIPRHAHAAPRLPPFGAGLDKDAVEPFGLGLVPHSLAAGHHQRLHGRGRLAALEHTSRSPQIFNSSVG